MGIKDEIMNDIADDIIEQLQYEIDIDGMIFSGQMRNGWEKKKQPDGSIIIGNPYIQADIMDRGRLPGKAPPMKALAPWVFQKLGAKDEADMRRKAFLLAKKIEREGIEPRHYISRALFKLEVGA